MALIDSCETGVIVGGCGMGSWGRWDEENTSLKKQCRRYLIHDTFIVHIMPVDTNHFDEMMEYVT